MSAATEAAEANGEAVGTTLLLCCNGTPLSRPQAAFDAGAVPAAHRDAQSIRRIRKLDKPPARECAQKIRSQMRQRGSQMHGLHQAGSMPGCSQVCASGPHSLVAGRSAGSLLLTVDKAKSSAAGYVQGYTSSACQRQGRVQRSVDPNLLRLPSRPTTHMPCLRHCHSHCRLSAGLQMRPAQQLVGALRH